MFVEIFEHCRGDGLQTGLGVSHGGGGIAVHGAEISLSIDEGVAHGEGLRQSDECVVDGAIAVGVISAHDLPDDLCAFLVFSFVGEMHFVHSV